MENEIFRKNISTQNHKKHKKQQSQKMGKINKKKFENLKIEIKIKRRNKKCQDIVNGTTYKQRKEKQMQQEEKSSQN
ncbi:MAG: hypothetical protein ACLSG7_06195 [Clostridia bacterium]